MECEKLLFEAAREGDLRLLKEILKENPSVLTDVRLTSLEESPLHTATKHEKLSFVRELLKCNPELANELNKDGLRPLDIAAILGNLEILKEFLSVDHRLCLLKGKEQRTPLHYAAIKGRLEIINELLSACPDSIKNVTVQRETVLHLAVKNYQFDAFSFLVKWLDILGELPIINWGDCNGLTVLHLAASTKQPECLELLLDKDSSIRMMVNVNAKSHKGLTASDILDVVTEESKGFRMREILQQAGAVVVTPENAGVTSGNSIEEKIDSDSEPSKDWFEYFKFKKQRDSPSNTRNALLVVAALIATVTFQAGVDPPSGLLTTNNNSTEPQYQGSPPPPHYIPVGTTFGLAIFSGILGSHATSVMFLFANSLGLVASLSIIIYLTGGFPFQMELHISMYSLMFAYGFAVNSIIKDEKFKKKTIAYVLVGIAFVLPFLLRWLPRWGTRAWKKWRKHAFMRQRPLAIEG